MSSEWLTYRLDEVGRIVTGKTPKSGVAEFEGEEVPFISPPDFSGNKWVTESARAISVAGAQSVKSSIIPPQSVLVTCIGSDMGKAAIAASTCVTNQQINAVVADGSRFSPEFLYYNLSLRKSEIRGLAGGSAQPILNKSAFGRISFEAPSLKEQLRIVDVLSPLDDRITLLRETNATLEAIAQALFKSWFVDFDPVHAKQQGRAPEGMDEATAALFPDAFEESELGLVPKGWRVGTLGDVARTSKRQLPVSELHSGLPYVGLEHIPRKSLALNEWATADGLESAKSAFSEGDILFGKLRPYFHKVVIAPISGVCSTDILVCQPVLQGFWGFVAMHLFSESMIAYADRLSNGAKMPRVNWKDLAAYLLSIPPHDVAADFSAAIEPLFDRLKANAHQAQTLATLRDTLLPRLISGQLRLPEAETLIEEIA